MKNSSRVIAASGAITLFYLLGIALDVTPWLRGPDEWRWAYALPGTLVRLWVAAVLLLFYVPVAGWLYRGAPTRRRAIIAVVTAVAMTPALQLALLYMDHPDVRSQLFYRTVSELTGGFFNVGAVVTDSRDFLVHFAERMSGYPVHPQRHPPGLPLAFAWARQMFDGLPAFAQEIGTTLRTYQCHNLPLMNLPDSAIASAILQMAVPVLLGLVVVPLYQLGRRVYDQTTAIGAVLLWPLVPSVALWATRWNHLYALFTVLAFLSFHRGLTERRQFWFLLCGLVVSLGTFLSFGNAVVAGFLGVYAFFWFIVEQARPRKAWLAASAGLFLTGFGLLWLPLWIAFDLSLVVIWRTAMGIHMGLGLSYVTWLFFHPYDFFVFLGIPLFIPWVGRTIEAGRRIRLPGRPSDTLTLAFAVGLLLLIVSGTSQGEVARVWAFLLPLPLLAAVSYLPPRSHLFSGFAALLSLQLFVCSIFLRPVSTGLSDPPPPPVQTKVEQDSQYGLAKWEGGITLLSAQFPLRAASGAMIPVSATWTTSQPINRPYTIFVHLVDSKGTLVSQSDGMPLSGNWFTTCWRPGYSFEDHYRLTLPDTLEEAHYQIRIGFYWLPGGERLPVDRRTAHHDHSVVVGTIRASP